MAFVNAVAIRPSTTQRVFLGSSFVAARAAPAVAPTAAVSKSTVRMLENMQPTFVKAMEDYKTQYAPFAERGWGATVKAERWNGRHVMFGWLMLVGTAYAKAHGMLPEGNLDMSQWGVLGSLGDQTPISNERAAILVAHIHFLFVSVAAAIAPFSFQDKLLLEKDEADAKPAGLFPPFKPGLNEDAEIWNGRVAMVGLLCLIGVSVASHQSILDTLNAGVGGTLF
jgi:Chlorophyll A-B binding protein